MAIPSWPAIAYAPRDTSFRQSANPGAVLETDMNSGTTRQRNQFTMAITVQQIEIVMSDADLASFQTFYRYTLGAGAARFSMPVWNGSAFVTRNVAIKADSMQAGFIGDGYHSVSITLRVENLY